MWYQCHVGAWSEEWDKRETGSTSDTVKDEAEHENAFYSLFNLCVIT